MLLASKARARAAGRPLCIQAQVKVGSYSFPSAAAAAAAAACGLLRASPVCLGLPTAAVIRRTVALPLACACDAAAGRLVVRPAAVRDRRPTPVDAA